MLRPMSSAKGRLFRFFSSVALREARVLASERRGELLEITLDAVDGAQPGDRIQVLLPGDDVRTYTPVPGHRPRLLVQLHGDTPGPRWARALRPGDVVRFKGPDRCVQLPEGPVALVGDATSIATALGFLQARPDQVTCLIEGPAPFEGLRSFSAGDHQAIAAAVPGGCSVLLTGGSALVQGVRAFLRERGLPARSKAYWAPGRVGMD